MATLIQAAKANNDAAVRALATVQSPEVIDPLLDIAGATDNQVHKTLALRGVVAAARLRQTPRPQAIAAIAKVLSLADDREKGQALAALANIPTIESFKLLAAYAENKALADAAGGAMVRIAPRVIGKDKPFVLATLKKVVENVRSDRTKNTAKKIIADHSK